MKKIKTSKKFHLQKTNKTTTNVNLDNIMKLIFKEEYVRAGNRFSKAPVPAQYNVEYELIKYRLLYESNVKNNTSIDGLGFDIVYPRNSDQVFFDVLLQLVLNNSWAKLKRYIKIARPLMYYIDSEERGLFLIFILILDFYMYKGSASDAVISDIQLLIFTDTPEYISFMNYALRIVNIFSPTSSLADNIVEAISDVVYINTAA